jgi:acetyltransferase-like isoleucine patch superfamily enzyme
VLKIVNKIASLFYKWYNRQLFKKVNCKFSTLHIGPEYCKDFNIKFPEKLSIGYGTVMNGNCMINAMGGIKIGNYCHIAKGLTIYSHNHNFKSKKSIPYDEENIIRPISIGDAVWIGTNVTIVPGSKIGDGVIISAGSVVFGNIPNCSIIRGNPAKIISYRNKDLFDRLKKEEKYY